MPSAAGSPTETLHLAVTKLGNMGALIRGLSGLYRTPAFPAGSGPDFVNAVIAIEAPWSARDAIARLHAIEAEIGRRRRVRWEQRSIDLDLLAHGDLVRPDMATLRRWMDLPVEIQRQKAPEQLILPHPRLHERGFVLVPMADVAPDWLHPALRRTVTQMRDALPAAERAAIRKLDVDWPGT